jgi:signal transduction histidine kinase
MTQPDLPAAHLTMTIRLKLILWFSGLLAIIIVVFGLTMFAVTRWVLVNSVDLTLLETVDQVWRNSNAALVGEFGSPSGIVIQLPELDVFRASSVVVQVWDMSEDTPRLARASSNLEAYNRPLDERMLLQEADHQFPPHESPVLYSNVRLNSREWRVLTRPIDVWGKRIVIQTATSMETVNQAGRGILLLILGSMIVAMFGSALVGMYLSHRALQPIKAITHAAARIATSDDLKTRLPWDGPMDELGRLTSVFNTMMERLEHLFSVQQRFVADVSHELRTPLTAIRGHLDLIKRYGMDPASFDAIESEVERMQRMVSDLLLLARADYGGLTLTLTPLDVDVVLTEAYRQGRALIKDRQLKLTIQDFEPVRVNGDADRLKQVLLNLISNAIKFTPDGGAITLNLRKQGDYAVIEVKDTGIGISPEDQKRVFDRFFQAEESRARDQGKSGVGLGLSIAKWIVEAHHGHIRVESEPGSGSTFIVEIPHIEERAVSPTAVTRPRLGLIRRGNHHEQASAMPSQTAHHP